MKGTKFMRNGLSILHDLLCFSENKTSEVDYNVNNLEIMLVLWVDISQVYKIYCLLFKPNKYF